jgi:hypothetical protein
MNVSISEKKPWREANMRRIALIAFAGLVVLAAACRKDTVTSPNAQGLTGTWQATKAEYVRADDLSLTYDVVAHGGTVTLTLTSTDFTLTVTQSGASPQVTPGTWTSTTDLMTLTPSGVSFTWVFEMSQSGNNLTLTGAHVEFDFNGDGTNEQARLNLTLVRQ